MDVLPYQVYSNKKILEKNGYNPKPEVYILYTFYNRIDFLKHVFSSHKHQTIQNFEVIICDDGSRPEVVAEIREIMKSYSFLIKHVWHEDHGFKKNEILNKGILSSETSYIIFIDQDCVLHPEFIKEHWLNRQKKKVLAGRRLELSPLITSRLSPEKTEKNYIQKNLWWILPLIAYRKDNQGVKGIYIRNSFLRKILNRKHRAVVGCNFSVHKEDLMSINGFDIRYNGVGIGEDSDIEYRLNLDGTETLPLVHMAVQYHLYHPYAPRQNNNDLIFEEVQKNKIKFSKYGISLIPKIETLFL